MAHLKDQAHQANGRSGELLGSLLLFIVLLFFVGAVLNNDAGAEETAVAIANTPTSEQNALNTVAPTPTIADTATPTATATPTNTPTPTLTPTATPTFTPSHTPNPAWSPTPTATASPTPPLPTPQTDFSSTITVTVPILMYHYISIPPEEADVYRTDLSVTPENFRAQMQYLADNGHTPIDFYTLSRIITNHEPLPPKPVILTFDDGYLDIYENAYPILQEFGFVGTFFIPTEFIDSGRAGYMTWPMIEEMAAHGHRFEPHSRTHPDLRARNSDYLIWEMLGPQETLAYHIGYTPRYFAYPSGRYDDTVLAMMQHLDFWGGVTTEAGDESGFANRFTWPRLRVRNNTPLAEFADLANATWD